MSHCVVTNNKEFRDLYKQVYPNNTFSQPYIAHLAAEISIYQEKEGLDKYPKANDINPIPEGQPIPLKGNENLYKKFNLLTKEGKIQLVLDNEKTKERLASLNRSPYYQFKIRRTPEGNRIFIFPNETGEVDITTFVPQERSKKNLDTISDTEAEILNKFDELYPQYKDMEYTYQEKLWIVKNIENGNFDSIC